MFTRSKCMDESEAAGEKNWEMENVSDTFHPPTTVIAAPDPILAQSEPPPNPTVRRTTTRHPRRAVRVVSSVSHLYSAYNCCVVLQHGADDKDRSSARG